MLRAASKQDSALDSIEEATEPIARKESGCYPPIVEIGTGIKCTDVPYVSETLAYLENFADHAAFRMLSGFWKESPVLAGVRGGQKVM